MTKEKCLKNDSTLHVTGLLFLLATGSFVWFYPTPLCGDMPMHVAVAKALVDLLAHTGAANYPYTLNIVFSSYALPEIILAFLVKLFGVIYASKIALTAYAIGFPLSIWFLVSQIEPEARWAKLIGFPLTLNYFFHWGFWSYMVGEITVICAIAMSIRYTSTKLSLLIGAPLRVLTFLMHPAPVIALGIYDTVTVLVDPEQQPEMAQPNLMAMEAHVPALGAHTAVYCSHVFLAWQLHWFVLRSVVGLCEGSTHSVGETVLHY